MKTTGSRGATKLSKLGLARLRCGTPSPRGYAQKIGLVDSCHHYDQFPVALRSAHVLGFPLFIP